MTGENIAWKTSVPLGGFNSPVVWIDRVFPGSNGRARELFCFDSGNGSLLWRLAVTLISDDAAAAMEIPEDTGLTPSTAATDGQRVFAIFATGELIAADFSGRMIWSKNLGKPENPFGHATSLLTWRDRLIVQLDQGEADAGKSRLYAFDAATGNVVWQQRRNVPSSWATPVLIDAGGREQIITLGEPWLISYSPAEGRELWRFEGMGSDLAPSPVFTGELVIAPSPNHALHAIRPDGQGDVTKTHLAWSATKGIPDITSPVSNGGLVFSLETSGVLTCFDARTGAMVWDHALKGDFHASPTIAGEHLYLISTEGDVFVVRGEPVSASPAIVNDRIFIRGATNLFCVAATASERKAGADAP
jgi:outer membrane protein assembly factor BamB